LLATARRRVIDDGRRAQVRAAATARLSLAADEAEAARLRLGAREMVLPGGMASSFQVLVQQKI
jgi:hypothetical protein